MRATAQWIETGNKTMVNVAAVSESPVADYSVYQAREKKQSILISVVSRVEHTALKVEK